MVSGVACVDYAIIKFEIFRRGSKDHYAELLFACEFLECIKQGAVLEKFFHCIPVALLASGALANHEQRKHLGSQPKLRLGFALRLQTQIVGCNRRDEVDGSPAKYAARRCAVRHPL